MNNSASNAGSVFVGSPAFGDVKHGHQTIAVRAQLKRINDANKRISKSQTSASPSDLRNIAVAKDRKGRQIRPTKSFENRSHRDFTAVTVKSRAAQQFVRNTRAVVCLR